MRTKPIMKNKIISEKIIEAEVDAIESKDHIVTGYLKIKFNNLLIDGFLPDWHIYFPYPTPKGYSEKYGLGDELLKNLKGKKIEFILRFVDYPAYTKILLNKEAGISLPNSANETILRGKIIKIEQNKEFPQNEIGYLDCGFYIFRLSIEKGKFKIGDYIRAEGRLDVYIKKIS